VKPNPPAAKNRWRVEDIRPETGSFEPDIILAINPDSSAWRNAREVGLLIERHLVLENLNISITRFRVPRGESAWKVLARLRKMGIGAAYELNQYYMIASRPEGAAGIDLRNFPGELIGWPKKAGRLGDGIRLGMVDSGVSTRIPALQKQPVITRSFAIRGKTSGSSHGTCIATILVGAAGSAFPGLLPQARLYAADAFSSGNSEGPHASALAIARALNWLVSQRVNVVNLSFSGPDNKLLEIAVARTLDSGIPLVAAAGNNGAQASPVFPAAYENVIAVTAVDRFRRLYHRANRGSYISFAAPGVMIWVPGKNGKGRYRKGTSYASAYCTAMAAQLLGQIENEGNTETLPRLLRENVIDLGPRGKDSLFGWGLIHCPGSCGHKH
jgi:subtilisin family serine protease